jgi:hypothetical protein
MLLKKEIIEEQQQRHQRHSYDDEESLDSKADNGKPAARHAAEWRALKEEVHELKQLLHMVGGGHPSSKKAPAPPPPAPPIPVPSSPAFLTRKCEGPY